MGILIGDLRSSAPVTVALALAFVLLPNLVAGNSWLTTLLACLTTLVFNALVAVLVGAVVLLEPW